MKRAQVVVIGSGPAGYTAAIYLSRARLEPVVYEGLESGPPGGQLMTTTEVENYPGFPEGVRGSDLMASLRRQAERFGTTFFMEDVVSVELGKRPFVVHGKTEVVESSVVVIATGAMAQRMDVPGTRDGELWQKGVTACAVCDGAMPIFRNRPLFVIGGGDSACEEALFLTHYGSRVFIVHRRNELRASKIMARRVVEHPKIEVVWDSVLVQVSGDTVVRGVTLENVKTHEHTEREAAGVFFAIGHKPNTGFLQGQLALDDQGYIKVTPGTCETGIPGVFACGDVQDRLFRQAVTAAGSGCMAALEAERWLSAQG